MAVSSIKTVGIVGTGIIGASWTALYLAHGLKVIVADPATDAEKKLADYLQSVWPTVKALGGAEDASINNYTFVGTSLKGHYQEVDFIQENAPERVGLKTDLIGEIDAETPPDVIIASSSSGIPSSKFVGKCTKNPGRVLICHPFNPPHLMPLVEIVPHPGTNSTAIDTAMAFYKSLGKNAVLLHKEVPGFCANRLQAALFIEAYSLVSRGIVSAEDVDTCMTSSLGPRWAVNGPLASNAMGAGGGSAGFKRFIEHLGPACREWIDDMKAHPFEWTPDEKEALTTSVDAELEGKDPEVMEKDRDSFLVEVIKMQKARQ